MPSHPSFFFLVKKAWTAGYEATSGGLKVKMIISRSWFYIAKIELKERKVQTFTSSCMVQCFIDEVADAVCVL